MCDWGIRDEIAREVPEERSKCSRVGVETGSPLTRVSTPDALRNPREQVTKMSPMPEGQGKGQEVFPSSGGQGVSQQVSHPKSQSSSVDLHNHQAHLR